MPRILRNYLISFALIGLFFLIVHGINRCVEARMEDQGTAPKPAALRGFALPGRV